MPCGGIYSLEGHWAGPYLRPENPDHRCFMCGDGGITMKDLFCEEWDCYLHYRCLGNFLASPEGACVLEHGHGIYVEERELTGEKEAA